MLYLNCRGLCDLILRHSDGTINDTSVQGLATLQKQYTERRFCCD